MAINCLRICQEETKKNRVGKYANPLKLENIIAQIRPSVEVRGHPVLALPVCRPARMETPMQAFTTLIQTEEVLVKKTENTQIMAGGRDGGRSKPKESPLVLLTGTTKVIFKLMLLIFHLYPPNDEVFLSYLFISYVDP